MTRERFLSLLLIALLGPNYLSGQALSGIAVVDLERATVQSVEGEKSSDKFKLKLDEKQKDIGRRQKELIDAQGRLRGQERVLSDAAKAELQGAIDRLQTELTRANEDAQKELSELRNELLRPIADIASRILNALAAQQGYAVVINVSNPENNVLWTSPSIDVTAELTRRIDAELAQQQPNKP